jgi:hypothetical protein
MSQPAASPDPAPARPSGPPIHPVAAAALLFVDNLWMLADWNALTWLLTIPLSFLSVAATTFFLQRFLHRDGWTKSFGKSLLLGIIAGVPTSVTGTPVGLALLTWAGILRARSGSTPLPLRTLPVAAPHQPPPAISVQAQVVPAPPPPPAPEPAAPPLQASAPQPRVEPWWVKLAMVLLLCGTILLATKMVLDRTAGIAAKFRQAHITETFTSALPQLARTPGGNLELATATATETVTRTDERTIAWDMIYLGKTVSEISVPVTYRFHLQLRDTWKLDVVGSTCVVRAPAIRPSLPPAIHTEGMQKRSEAGWARFDAREQMAELERSLTPRLARTAGDPRRLATVREECRKTVAEFVRDWLLREDHWRRDRFTAIQVTFADEPVQKSELAPPVILLK